MYKIAFGQCLCVFLGVSHKILHNVKVDTKNTYNRLSKLWREIMEKIDRQLNESWSKDKSTGFSDSYSHSFSSAKKAKESCHICSEMFNFRRPKKVCCRCDLSVCKEHSRSSAKKGSRICDICKQEEINERVSEEIKPIITKKYEILQVKAEEVKVHEESIKNHLKTIEKTEKKKKLTLEAYTDTFEQLNCSIGIQKEITESLEQQVRELQSIRDTMKVRGKEAKKHLQVLQKEFDESREEVNGLVSENAQLSKSIQEHYVNLTQLLNLQQLRSMLCGKCFSQIKKEAGIILGLNTRKKAPNRESMVDNRCKGCFIF